MATKLLRYEWMTKYTPQVDWIEGKGVFLWLAFFFSEIGAGIYIVSLFLNFRAGWLVGWLVSLVLGGIVHLAYLGNPMRGWRIFLRPTTSELSRGMWAIFLFAAFGFFQVVPIVVPGLPWTGENSLLKTIMGILCILIMAHGFLTMNVVKALPMWNSSMMIPLSLVSGAWVGSQTAELGMFMRGWDITTAELWVRWSLIGYVGILFMYLFGTAHSSETARVSIQNLLKGDSAVRFYVGVLAVGIVIPMIITLMVWGNGAEKLGSGTLSVRLICVLIGDLTMRYSIMRSAVYSPAV